MEEKLKYRHGGAVFLAHQKEEKRIYLYWCEKCGKQFEVEKHDAKCGSCCKHEKLEIKDVMT